MEAGSEGEMKKPPEGETKTKRKMKTASQLEILEKTYAVETYPSEALRAELSVKLGLSDRQLQMWFCHRRLKDRKPPAAKRQRKDSPMVSAPVAAPVLPLAPMGVDETGMAEVGIEYGSGSGSGSPFTHMDYRRIAPRAGTAVARIGADVPTTKRYYESPQSIAELRAISFVEAQLGEPLREDGPILGMEFDPLPPDAFGAPIAPMGQQDQAGRGYEAIPYERADSKLIKGSSRAFHEYQFLPERPSVRTDSYERVNPSYYYGSPADGSGVRPSTSGRSYTHAIEQVPSGYGFQSHMPSLNLLPQQSRQGNIVSSSPGDYDTVSRKNAFANINANAHLGPHPITAVENPFISPERKMSHDEEVLRMERKRKSEEARIAREVEAHEKRIRKELEKQDILRRKREEQIRKEMERHDRERRKEEERLLREKQREEERYQKEQRRELERREKFLQKESQRAEKMRQKEELRREKEAARLKAANDRAIARRIAKESMELIEDERLELMELAASRKGLPSILSLDGETLQNLELFRDSLAEFPPKAVQFKRPFSVKPWTDSEENMGNLLMVWEFLITFSDVLGLWPFTLDEFIQAFHDYDPRLLNEIHISLLKSIIKDIEDVARTPSMGVGMNQNCAANLGGGHPQIVEGAYAWGFDIRSWQSHLNALTWPEILRQFALSAGFGPQLKKRSIEESYVRDENDSNDGGDIISNLRNGIAAENAVAIMHERGFSNPRRSRHRLTPGTVKFAAFHVLSLEGSKGLTILEVADRIQRSGLRDLTTSKTPEASIAAALSRDVKLFERTAPSTYCVRTPYRKDPENASAILTEARERIQVFKNGFSDGEEADDAERDEDSESDVAEDPEVDDLDSETISKAEPHHSFEADEFQAKTPLANGKEIPCEVVAGTPCSLVSAAEDLPLLQAEEFKEATSPGPSIDQPIDVARISKRATITDEGETDIDESNPGEPWVLGLMEGEYSDLSVEERLDALVALIRVATEGNSIRFVLEERLEAANALKKQMWADAQLDKRRMKEEYMSKMQYSYIMGNKTENSLDVSESRQSPLMADDKNNDVLVSLPAKQEQFTDAQNDNNYPNNLTIERNITTPEFSTIQDNVTLQQPGYVAEKSRSQVKSYIGHKAEELYVYRSLPLGQDRRRNRYWQFITSASRNDPGCGRIFVELRNGFWRLIDSEEAFDALLASLDTRGIRESHLHMMLQKIEMQFKGTLRHNLFSPSLKKNDGSLKTETPDIDADSPNSIVCASDSDILETSSSFTIELGKTDVERSSSVNRYREFEKWMWQECFHSSILSAMKHGKNRCTGLLRICEYCHDVYIFKDDQCPCRRNSGMVNSSLGFPPHVESSKETITADCDWILDHCTLPLRVKLIKGQLASVEVCLLPEAIQSEWTEDYRKSWGMKLHAASSAEDLLQVLTMLETAIRTDFLSSRFETTTELLRTSTISGSASRKILDHESVPVLPWVPHTTAAVALRLMELDTSISYTLSQKADFQKEKEARDFTQSAPSSLAVVKNVPEEGATETECPQEDNWSTPVSGNMSSGRGRGGRGRGRGRTRGGGRPQKKVKDTRPESNMRNTVKGTDRLGQALAWKGRSRGRGGRRRGRRTVRSGQKPVKQVAENVHDRGPVEEIIYEESPMNMGGEDWNLEDEDQRMEVDDAESSSSDGSEYDDDNVQASGDEYDDMAAEDYAGAFDGKPDDLLEASDDNVEGDETEDIREDEGDDDVYDEGDPEGIEDEQGYAEGEEYIDYESNEENGENGDEDTRMHGMPDEETSSSSEYSE